MKRLVCSGLLASVALLIAFTVRLSDIPSLPATAYNYANLALPHHFNNPNIQQIDNTPVDNPVTDAGATLGRVLFYDARLSIDETISCASCHFQTLGFADPDSVSTGVFGLTGTRNAMSLANIRFYRPGRFLWDEAGPTLEEQTLFPIELEHEMGNTIDEAIMRLEATTFYPELFTNAFGTSDITPERMGSALAQFLRSIVTFRTRYDAGRALVSTSRVDFPNFTDEENEGKDLYFFGRARCSACHRGDIQSLFHNFSNGLDSTTTDPGIGGHTGQEEDMGRFKAPSLRNVALTAPYMHDGRFATLEEVVEFYNSGVQAHPNLGNALKDVNGDPRRLNLSEDEKASIVAFLKTLTDEPMTTDVRWSDPFLPFIFLVTPLNTDIPATGGTASANIDITNTDSAPVTFTLRIEVTTPNSHDRLLLKERTFTPAPGQSITVEWSETIHAGSPSGTYTIHVTAEEQSGIFLLSTSFTFEKHEALLAHTPERASATAAAASVSGTPASFGIRSAFPNPFSQSTTVRFDIPEAADVTVEVMGILGRRIALLADGPLEAGTHEVLWEPAGLPAGFYFVRVQTGNNQIETQRITLVR